MRVAYARLAGRDLDEIAQYIARNRPDTAQRVYRRIVEVVDGLARNPYLGRPGLIECTREFVIPRLPYLIVYRVADGTVTILAALHTARDLGAVLAGRGLGADDAG